MEDKKNKELKKKLDEVIVQIKNNSKDSRFADTLVSELLSLKGQIDVVPTIGGVEVKKVKKTYDFGSFCINRAKNAINFHVRGGYDVTVSMRCKSLYDRLSVMLELRDIYDSLDEESKKGYDFMFTANYYILAAPLLATYFDDVYYKISSFIAENVKEASEKLLNTPLQEEEYEKDAEFENLVETLETLEEGNKNVRNS